MAYLISGSSGFIGAGLCQKLALNAEVFAVYHNTPPVLIDKSNIQLVPFSRINDLKGICGIDTVIHCAAVHPNSLPEPPSVEKYIQANCMLTKILAEVANSLSVRQFLYLSTVSVYGDVRAGCLDEESPFLHPGAYGTSKYMGELIVKEVSMAPKRLSLRLPGVVGGSSRHAWLCGVKQKALSNLPICVYNPESLFNNITTVSDIIRFIKRLSASPINGYDVVNLATSEPVTIMAAVKKMIDSMGSKSMIEVSDAIRESYYISTERLSNKYRFTPSTTLDSIVRYSAE